MRTPEIQNPKARIQNHLAEGAVLCVAAALAFFGAFGRPVGDLANSRLATVYSLTKDGTFYVDRPLDEPPNPYAERTIDKVEVRGRKISSKPPMLTLFMTAEYVALKPFLGWDIARETAFEREQDARRLVLVATVTLVSAAYVVALIFFLKMLYLFGLSPFPRLILLFGLAFGTQLWGFSTLFNNHVPGMCMLLVALYFAYGLASGKLTPTPWRFFLFGLAAGFQATLDVPGTIFAVLAGLGLLFRSSFRRHPSSFSLQPSAYSLILWSALGAAIPLGIHAGVMTVVTGTPLPVQTDKSLYLAEDSYWRAPLGIDGLNEPKLTYLFHMTFGRKGIFSLFPILLVGVAGAVRALVKRRTPLRGPTLMGAAGFAILTAYYVLRTNDYGGEAYGFRWYIVAMPILLLMGAPMLASFSRISHFQMGVLQGAKRVWWRWAFIAILLAVSCYSANECAHTGFKSSQEWTCRILGPSFSSGE